MNLRFLVCISLILFNIGFFMSTLKATTVEPFNVMLNVMALGVCGVAAYKNIK